MSLCMVRNVLSWGPERSQIVACDVPSSAGGRKESEINCVQGVLMKNDSEGSLPWRFSTVNLKEVSHGD